MWYSWGFFSGFSISDKMGHDGPRAIPYLPPDSFLAPKTDHRNEQIKKKGEQISELHKPSESMATFIIYI